MRDIIKIQERFYKFQKMRTGELGADLNLELVFIHLNEEIGEIARQLLNKKYPNFRKYDEENLQEEIVQTLLDLLLLAKLANIDLPNTIDYKINEIENRNNN